MYLRTLIGPRAGEILDFSPAASVAMLNDGRAEMVDDDGLLPAGVILPKKPAKPVKTPLNQVSEISSGAQDGPEGPEATLAELRTAPIAPISTQASAEPATRKQTGRRGRR